MTSTSDTSFVNPARTLRRCRHHRMIGGVAAGLALYLDVDLMMVRIAWAVLALVGGVAIPIYLAAWLLIPEEDAATSIAEDLMQHFAGV
jgi:phage shock protein PspC (stress-responsive transcriptional regulator)